MQKLYLITSKISGEEVRRVFIDEIKDNGKVLFLFLNGKSRGFYRKDRFNVKEIE